MKSSENVVEKSPELVGKTVGLKVLTQMMAAEGAHFRHIAYETKIPSFDLVKRFALKSDALLQRRTWINQLTLNDGETGVVLAIEKK